MPRKAIFKNGVKKITLRLPIETYEWILRKAKEEDEELSRVIRKCIFHVMKEEKQNEP